MQTQPIAPESADAELALRWMEACGSVVRRKTAALIRNDLAELEECLEEEEKVIAQFAEVRTALLLAGEERPDVSSASVRSLAKLAATKLAAEVRSINQRNAVLVRTGMDFSRTLLSSMRPPTTYSRMPQNGSAGGVPNESIFSVEF